MIHATLLIACFQAPDPPADRDVVRLAIGTELVGTIVRETADYIELQLSEGTVVGFDKARTVSIVRGSNAVASAAADAPATRERWNVLHDGAGRAVGWLHTTVTSGEGHSLRIGEEWRFRDDEGTIELTLLETVDAHGSPESAFYHERVRDPLDDRILSERLVRAVIERGQLVVTRRSKWGEERRSYDLPAGLRFPLELLNELRRQPVGRHATVTRHVFDVRTEQFAQREFDIGRTREIDVDGKRATVRTLTITGSRGVNAEWLDASSDVIRREINGPALVAVPSTEAEAKRSLRLGSVLAAPAFLAEPGGRFGMWLPNPQWGFVEPKRDGQLVATAATIGANVSLVAFDHVDADVGVESAADAIWRWLALLHPDLQPEGRSAEAIRDVDGVRLRGRYEGENPDGSRVRTLDVRVFAAGGRFLALCCDAPRSGFARVATDFERILAGLELHRSGFAPELQGPLSAGR